MAVPMNICVIILHASLYLLLTYMCLFHFLNLEIGTIRVIFALAIVTRLYATAPTVKIPRCCCLPVLEDTNNVRRVSWFLFRLQLFFFVLTCGVSIAAVDFSYVLQISVISTIFCHPHGFFFLREISR